MTVIAIKKKLWVSVIFLTLITILILSSCTEDVYDPGNSSPEFVSASVDDAEKNRINVRFSQDINTSAEGFIIKVESTVENITKIEGSGSAYITFTIENEIKYNESVSIEYDASNGNAANNSGLRLSSFSPKIAANYINETEFSVLIPNLPPEAKEDTVWLVIKTVEAVSTWKWDFEPASINIILTAIPETTPFDIVIFAPENGNWRPDMDFEDGYYASLLNQTNIYQELKVVSWLSASDLSGTDMGYINNLSDGVENIDIENSFLLKTDGLDYVEGNVTSSNQLWYKFLATDTFQFEIMIKDEYAYSNDFTGVAKATLCADYGIPLTNVSTVIGSHSTTITGNGELVFIKVEQSDLGGQPGNFQILVNQL